MENSYALTAETAEISISEYLEIFEHLADSEVSVQFDFRKNFLTMLAIDVAIETEKIHLISLSN